MIVSEKHKFVFIAIPKTGTRSIYKILKEKYEGFLYREHFKEVPKEYKKYYKFTTIRNPYDRFISMWWSTCKRKSLLNKNKSGSNFKELAGSADPLDLLNFMINTDYKGRGSELFSRQTDFIKSNKIDKIIKFENLNQEFNSLPFVNENINLPVLNSTKSKSNNTLNPRHTDYNYYLNKDIIHMINEYYKDDFNLLNYDKK